MDYPYLSDYMRPVMRDAMASAFRSSSVGQIITAITNPSGQLFVGESASLNLAGFATFDSTSNYASSANDGSATITSVDYQINGVTDTGNGTLSDGDVASFLVTDSEGNARRFSLPAVRQVAPTAIGGLVDQSFSEDSGVQTYDASGDFTGVALVYTINAVTGVTVNSGTGVVSFDTDTMAAQSATSIVVTATNSGGQANSGFNLSITASTASITVEGGTGEAVATGPTGSTDPLTITIGGTDYTQSVPSSLSGTAQTLSIALIEANPQPLTNPVGSGTTGLGDTITWVPPIFVFADNDPGDATFQVQSDGVDIAGANGLTFDITASEQGTDLRLVTTYPNYSGGAAVVVTSPVLSIPAAAGAPDAFVNADWSVATGAGSSELDVSIATLPANNGSAITDVEYDIDGSDTWISLATAVTGTTTITMASPSTSYAIRLRAVNAVGEGPDGNGESAVSGASGAAWTPASDAASFAAWYDPSDTGTRTLSGSNVTSIADSLGKASALSLTAGIGPTLANLGGVDVLNWDKADGAYFDCDVDIGEFGSVFTLVNVASAGQSNLCLFSNGVGSAYLPLGIIGNGSADWFRYQTSGESSAQPTLRSDTVDTTTTTRGGAFSAIATDTETIVEFECKRGDGANSITALRVPHSVAVYRWSGTQGDILCSNGEISTALRAKAEGYFAHKYGRTARLPSDHPYKTSAPTE